MSDVAIHVENLSKMYHIGKAREQHDMLRDALMSAMRAPRRWFGRNGQGSEEEAFWALRDVSFEVKRGEVVGVIGRNGAGKSTLLKILSRITEPTTGRAEIHGRVGSLLEVGTGFHPELTGRENIYLNGAILGMRRTEIDRKFDEIVDFSGVERFLDTPVKRYSSGMYVRLAFAVAAHMETEVLLIDEVLAVGDAEFQKKCLGKMGDVAKEGRTVLFVSHNIAAVERLCMRVIVLQHGGVAYISTAGDAVAYYEETMLSVAQSRGGAAPPGTVYQKPTEEPCRDFEITCIELLDKANQPKSRVYTWDEIRFRIHYCASRPVTIGSLVFQLSTLQGTPLLMLSTQPDSAVPMTIQTGNHYADCLLEQLPLSAGSYLVGAGLAVPNKEWLCWNDSLGILIVQERDVYQSGLAPVSARSLLATQHTWKLS